MPEPEATTLSIHAVLGLSAAELDDALVWARGRAVELLESLDDAELRALLDRELAASPPRPTTPTPAASPPRPTTPTPAASPPKPLAPAPLVPSWGLPPVPRIPSRFVETLASKSASLPDPGGSAQGNGSASEGASRPPSREPPPARPSAPPRAVAAPPPMPPRAPAPRAVPQREPDAPAVRNDHTRRRAQRYSLSTPVVVRIDRMPGLLELSTRDISLHGIFIETNAPPQCHDRIAVQLPFPDGSGVVNLVGEVVRVVTTRQAAASGVAPGFGVTFSPVSDESQRDLERLLEHAKSGAAADVPRPRSATVTQARTVQHVRSPGAKLSKG
jgi:hypothetical protein